MNKYKNRLCLTIASFLLLFISFTNMLAQDFQGIVRYEAHYIIKDARISQEELENLSCL